MAAAGRRCDACDFFQPQGDAVDGVHSGECRRHPPRIVVEHPEFPAATAFPQVAGDEWCGEFRWSRKGEGG